MIRRVLILAVLASFGASAALAQDIGPELIVTARTWSIVSPAGDPMVQFTDRGSNAASSDGFRGTAQQMNGGVIRGVRDIEGGRATSDLRDAGLAIGAGDGVEHRGTLSLNPDIGSDIKLMNGHGRTCVHVTTRWTDMTDCRGHKLARFGPHGITFFVKPKVRR